MALIGSAQIAPSEIGCHPTGPAESGAAPGRQSPPPITNHTRTGATVPRRHLRLNGRRPRFIPSAISRHPNTALSTPSPSDQAAQTTPSGAHRPSRGGHRGDKVALTRPVSTAARPGRRRRSACLPPRRVLSGLRRRRVVGASISGPADAATSRRSATRR